MMLKRRTGVILIGMVLAICVLVAATRPALKRAGAKPGAEGSRASESTPPAQSAAGGASASQTLARTDGSDWSMQITPQGRMFLLYKGTIVASTQMHFFGAKFATYAGSKLDLKPEGNGLWSLSGGVRDFKVTFTGAARTPATNQLELELNLMASDSLPEVVGGGWQWDFKLDSPAFSGRAPDPQLLPENRGWTWPVGPGQAISFRVAEGAAKVYFERNQKNTVRTFLISDQLAAGSRTYHITLELPEGGTRKLDPSERYEPARAANWFHHALDDEDSPVDLSFLNRDDRPAGKHGRIHADGNRMVFEDGTVARFWGSNIAAFAIFAVPRNEISIQAKRMARLGYNLMRIHHHDTEWVHPNVFGMRSPTTRKLDPKALDTLDWWIKCLKDEGIYVWLDFEVLRTITPADRVTEGAEDLQKKKGLLKAFCYYNTQIQDLMKEFQEQYLSHVNRYTKLAYRDDPALVGLLLTNENDLMQHNGNLMLPNYKFLYHSAVWTQGYKRFAQEHGLTPGEVYKTWEPGPSKLYLAESEHLFNQSLIGDLRRQGVSTPLVTTSSWGEDPLYCLAPLTDGEWIDVHTYGKAEELSHNPHHEGTFADWIAMGQVSNRPLSITEWNIEFPTDDRFVGPLWIASQAAFQGWDAPMIFAYSQGNFNRGNATEKWSTYYDPALTGLMPAAALMYRKNHVAEAKKTYCLMLDSRTFFGRAITPQTSTTVRTLSEQSRLTIGIPPTPELPWLKPILPEKDAIVVSDLDRDFIPRDQDFVRSDTGELTRNWTKGIQTIDTPKTQAVSGWIGGETLATHDASFTCKTKKAALALTSIDDKPLAESRFILVTAIARAIPDPKPAPKVGARYLSEPVYCQISLRSSVKDLELVSLSRTHMAVEHVAVERTGDTIRFELPTPKGTHWYLLRSR